MLMMCESYLRLGSQDHAFMKHPHIFLVLIDQDTSVFGPISFWFLCDGLLSLFWWLHISFVLFFACLSLRIECDKCKLTCFECD